MRIEEEIKQEEFSNPLQKAIINILFTASWISGEQNRALKPFGISWQQFNILRILRGQYPESVCVADIKERMIDKMSNVSRLVEKLYQKDLVTRETSKQDRRMVDIELTTRGLELLKEVDEVMEDQQKALLSANPEALLQLNDLLDQMRGC
ncbi:MAG TPA: MarR family transcriptional regulator [Cytophagales bacterium]|nr:MarR family transcriptional regulator [Cytophagales bacterium]HAA20116.1 MarR family transcriptional regulator [Cytophagales bacterium]HAP64076.1 MarR family transcriptional regulator [Cytophagales bacterium]